MIVGYLRVSSRAQDAASQRAAIERAATARGEWIEGWYSEQRSGGTMRRPALDELRADARTGIVNRIYTFKLDRLTRTGVSDTFALLNEFKLAGCELIAVADNLHLKLGEDDMQTVVFQFALGLAAKLERQAIGERIAAARNRLEAEGRAWGRPARLTGLKLEQAKALRAEGRSIREIAVAKKVPRSTVGRALSQKGGSNEKVRNQAGTADSPPQQGRPSRVLQGRVGRDERAD